LFSDIQFFIFILNELQMITDHARRDSVLKYADVQVEAKRRLMMGKIIP